MTILSSRMSVALALLGSGTLGGCEGGLFGPASGPIGLAVTAGADQVGFAGQPLGRSIEVRVTRGGEASRGEAVEFVGTEGVTTIDPAVATTDEDGVARVSVTLGDAGDVRLVARLSAPDTASIAISAVAVPLHNRELIGQIDSVADLEVDAARGRFYVTVPYAQRIDVVSLTGQIVERVYLDRRAFQIAPGVDGQELYATLGGFSGVVAIDLETFEQDTIPVSTDLLRTDGLNDVVSLEGGQLVVAPEGAGRIVRVPRANPGAATVVADGESLGGGKFAKSQDGSVLLLLAGRVRRLDVSNPALPQMRISERIQTSFAWIDNAGGRVYTSGDVWHLESLAQLSFLPPGIPVTNTSASKVLILEQRRFAVVNPTTFTREGFVSIPVGLVPNDVPFVRPWPDVDAAIVYSGRKVYLVELPR